MRAMPATPPAASASYAPDSRFAAVEPGRPLTFPGDFGSHPHYRIEWWYVTGWLRSGAADRLGFQITFFRTRPDIWRGNPSAFSPRQVLIGHCALADPHRGRLWRAETIARAGFGLAEALPGDTAVWIDHWRLRREGDTYRARCEDRQFALELALRPQEPPMLNGEDGYSRKGPAIGAASEYYSLPHLAVRGRIVRAGRTESVHGEAWLDHEWSSAYLDASSIGWDWVGINLDDGGALMAFRIRGRNGTTRWAGGTLRAPGAPDRSFAPGEVAFEPLRSWRSPRTAVLYPVEWRVRAGSRTFLLRPLMDDQENDVRATSGTIYWEGAVRAYEHGRPVGRGYLELTGYDRALHLR
ncbi:MAG: carotenoid 1,2-hydratase [Gammaproteobacteria bacterium]|nr:carotenoid 1,2-hydratase [Gammaproteobacteria bacterium]